MGKRYIILIVGILMYADIYGQKHYEIGIAFDDQTIYNNAITLADESFLLILNHTTQDTSYTELLKVDSNGDTLLQKEIRVEGYTISSAGVATASGLILSVALAEGCHFEATNFGFAFIELDVNLNEVGREIFLDKDLIEFPVGMVKFSSDKFYCFYAKGVYVFDRSFNYIKSYSGFQHRKCTALEVLNNKIVCTNYDSTGIEVKNLDGSTHNFLPRKIVNGIAVFQNEIYVTVQYGLLKLDTSLNILDSLNTFAVVGTVWHPKHLVVYKEQLVLIDNDAFSRFTLPDLKIINFSYGNFENGLPIWLGYNSNFVANDESVGCYSTGYGWGCIPGQRWYFVGYFESSYAGYSPNWQDTNYYSIKYDSLWIDTVSRYEDYSSNELNVDVALTLGNHGNLIIHEVELFINHNWDTACHNPLYLIQHVKGLNLKPGTDTTLYFRNLKLVTFEPIDSLLLNITSNVITIDKKLRDAGRCGYDYRFLTESDIVERQRPLPSKGPSTFTIYPNPTKSELKFDGVLETGAELRIFNVNGQLVLEKRIEQQETDFVLDLSRLPDAAYFLEIKNSNFQKVTEFIKM